MNREIEDFNKSVSFAMHIVQHYNPEKYWKWRAEVINPNSRYPKALRFYWLYRIKRMDAFNCASMGTSLGSGAVFDEPPNLLHGLNGIVISHFAHIGKHCAIAQQVTIGGGDASQFVTIGDNVFIGAGAKIQGPVKIGNNVQIGANTVVVKDVPDNCTVVGARQRVIFKDRKNDNKTAEEDDT